MKIKASLTILCSAAILSACTPTSTQRGNLLEDYQVDKLVQGIHTRTDVLRLLGSPTTQATFDENIWYYIGQETEKRGILDPEVTRERIFVVAFNDDGVVEQFQEIDSDRIDIPYERGKTPTHGNRVTLLQQFLGNLGRFNSPE